MARVADLTTPPPRCRPRTALLLLHAQGDEQVPYTISEELHAAAGEPKRLLVIPGGHHRSIQHDLELQAVSAALHRGRGAQVARLASTRPGHAFCKSLAEWLS